MHSLSLYALPVRHILLEVCVDTVDGALAAERAGADRVELCSALELGGLTPGPGTLAEARERLEIPLVVLVRPRRGDFLYSPADLAAAWRDVEAARAAGADGVALGLLDQQGDLDRERTAALVELARPMTVTFHRAFDLARDRERTLEQLVELGLERVLTAGGASDVETGREALTRLVDRAAGRIAVMAGGGVQPATVAHLVAETGVPEVHLSARVMQPSAMRHRNPGCALGSGRIPGEYELARTDPELVRATLSALRQRG